MILRGLMAVMLVLWTGLAPVQTDQRSRRPAGEPQPVVAGREDGNTVEFHCWLITNRLIKGNVDVAIDHHPGGTGIEFARFVFAYADDPESLTLASLFPVDQIMKDPGLPGTLEYALVKAGIPAVTTELGGPRGFVADMVKLGVDGNANVRGAAWAGGQDRGRHERLRRQ